MVEPVAVACPESGVAEALEGVAIDLEGVNGTLEGVIGVLDGVSGTLEGVCGALDGVIGVLDGVPGAAVNRRFFFGVAKNGPVPEARSISLDSCLVGADSGAF